VGHAGTLDPMATGVLVLGLGRGTKLLGYITGVSKTYLATIRLGSSTPTDDADSEPDSFARPEALAAVDTAAIESAVAAQRGFIDQVPSAVSAIKIDGRRSYARVRAGEDVELKSRRVEVSAFEIIDIRFAADEGHIDVDVEIDCSSGTYVRALARDICTDLGVFGHLTALRRIRVGDFELDRAVSLPEDLDAPPGELISLAEAAGTLLPVVRLGAAQAQALMQGEAAIAAALGARYRARPRCLRPRHCAAPHPRRRLRTRPGREPARGPRCAPWRTHLSGRGGRHTASRRPGRRRAGQGSDAGQGRQRRRPRSPGAGHGRRGMRGHTRGPARGAPP